MIFVFVFFFLHFGQVLSENERVKGWLAVQFEEDQHPDHDIVAGCYFVENEKLRGQFLEGMLTTLANKLSEDGEERLFGAVDDDFVSSFVDPLDLRGGGAASSFVWKGRVG